MVRRLLCILLALALTGCTGEQARRGMDTAQVSNRYFGLAWADSVAKNPVCDTSSINRLLYTALYESLFVLGDNFIAQTALCQSYTGDGTNFEFTLRDDVLFWSGEPLTADDVLVSLNTARYDPTSPYYDRMRQIDVITAPDEHRVQITLSSPNIHFPRLLEVPIFRAGTQNELFADGTGPFRPIQLEERWVLVANENWHGGYLGSVRRISLVPVESEELANAGFRTGDVSMTWQPRLSGEVMLSGSGASAVKLPSTTLHYIGVRHDHDALGSPALRRALSAAIDRAGLCDTVLQGFATPAMLAVNPQPSDESLGLHMSADMTAARTWLNEYFSPTAGVPQPGWAVDLPATTVPRETVSFRFLVNADNPFHVAMAEQLAIIWNAMDGLSCTVVQKPYDQYLEALSANDFDLFYGKTALSPDFNLRPLLFPGGALNFGGYVDSELSTAVAAAQRGDDATRIHVQFLQKLPFIPLCFEYDQLILRRDLIDNLTPLPHQPFYGLQNWTSPD